MKRKEEKNIYIIQFNYYYQLNIYIIKIIINLMDYYFIH